MRGVPIERICFSILMVLDFVNYHLIRSAIYSILFLLLKAV